MFKLKRIIQLFAFTIVLSFISPQINAQNHQHINKFQEFFEIVQGYYVDSVQDPKLITSAIKEILEELDPHSTYISKEDVKAMNQPLEGNFEGIGIQFNILNDTILVVSTIPGGPSEKVGLKAGDRIIKIKGEKVAGIGIENQGVRDRLMGEKGTEVSVSIKREGVHKLLKFNIVRDEIPIHSLDASYLIDNNTGYIKLNRFSATTIDEFQEAFIKLKQKGMEDLVLDLRGNSGGYLKTARRLADQFLEDSKMIVYTQGRKSPRRNYRAISEGTFENGKLSVLIDEGSASASEIVAGAIQDWDRGVLIGRRSFGKGLVQRPFRLPDSSMIRLTIARYYTPLGRLIQKPYKNSRDAYKNEIQKRYEHGEMVHPDSINFPDSLKYYTKKNDRVVYGGGGIMPDIFIPADTSEYSDYYRKIVGKGIMNNFTISYIDNNRKKINEKYDSFKKYKNTFEVSSSMLDNLKSKAKAEGVEFNEEQYKTSKTAIKQQIKALIARDVWNTSEYYEILNADDEAIKRAAKIMNSDKLYKSTLQE